MKNSIIKTVLSSAHNIFGQENWRSEIYFLNNTGEADLQQYIVSLVNKLLLFKADAFVQVDALAVSAGPATSSNYLVGGNAVLPDASANCQNRTLIFLFDSCLFWGEGFM